MISDTSVVHSNLEVGRVGAHIFCLGSLIVCYSNKQNAFYIPIDSADIHIDANS